MRSALSIVQRHSFKRFLQPAPFKTQRLLQPQPPLFWCPATHYRPILLQSFFTSLTARDNTPPTEQLPKHSPKKSREKRPTVATPQPHDMTTYTGQPLDRANLDTLLRRRMFYAQAFDIYGGVSGLFDYGPPGCALQANIVDTWRKHFILEEDMLEVDCTMLTPHDVLKTSGHVDKFSDWMCKDPKTGEIFRADHLVEEVLEARLKGDKQARHLESGAAVEETAKDIEGSEDKKKRKKKVKDIKVVKLEDSVVQEYEETLAKIDNYDGNDLGEIIIKHHIKNPGTGGDLEPPVAFNLMFGTSIGPSSNLPGYLRPETAQGQFLNFQKLLGFNNEKMPFASASIGKSFRNEISPRQGLLRVREFLMAEIEHFVDPENKSHPRFSEVADTVTLNFLPKEVQQAGKTTTVRKTIGEAVREGMVDNETLGYFLARINLFLKKIGVDENKVRFRQHMENEMAHYASDCWDAELQTSYGWIECVGCADRSAYDLSVHQKKTGQFLGVRETLKEPRVIEEYEVDINKKVLGPKFKKDAKAVEERLAECSNQKEREAWSETLKNGQSISVLVEGLGKLEIGSDLVTVEKRKRTESVREYTPNVIEPSFGIGRILYSLMEHVFWTRPEDADRAVLSFPPTIAPTKVLLVPLSNNVAFNPLVNSISSKIRKLGISSRVDSSGATIGKRYSRNDELGTPFGITIDFQSVKDDTITLRERDTTKQVRGSVDEVLAHLKALVEGHETWEETLTKLPIFTGQDVEE
ncbi:Glycine--tRNA ligase 1, mitochondrial [Orbilia oligospora]|uniref:glycine--tRNA ligase n=1 Tax=Orbilia oligospora TaxID=2813651 RepID=A0A7C8UT00_ORBOL|nr:Glycine--tRNA ligase 1, mitochondrial [Orbilia oligospora]